MKIKYIIPTVGDGNNTNTASHLLRIDEANKSKFLMYNHSGKLNKNNVNAFGEFIIRVPRVVLTERSGDDPVLNTVSKTIAKYLFPKDKGNFMNNMGFKYFDYDYTVYYGKTNGKFYINGTSINKADLLKALSKIIIRSTLTRSGEQLIRYGNRVITFPHNVLYALENRTPYTFVEEFRKTEVIINTKLISESECVLEISDSIWGVLSLKELNGFIEYFKYGRRRHKKWIDIPLEGLWTQVMGESPSRTQLEMMRQWLLQHRTQDLVENRATKLLFDIDAENPNIKFVQYRNASNKALFVRGKYCDWVIVYTGTGMKRGRQDVTTYQIQESSLDKGNWHGMKLSGAICIDNVSNKSSIGDQLVARALALVDERIAAHHLYTIKPFITTALLDGSTVSPRMEISKLKDWTQRASDKYDYDKKQRMQKRPKVV